MLDVRILGEVPYEDAQALMKELQQQRIEGAVPDTLLILSHPEVVTVGPRARNDGIRPPADYTTVAVDRGGGLTWHGPGQVVGYPIVKWGEREGEASVADIIYIIEGWLIETLAIFGVEGERDERMQGVWVD
ncbi:MAG: lipoate-protein ligase B, partial [Candidatus Thermoplasmatota archaeon]|nr:lipoate-protein ligase B [Candidatus Thermoplasmatota archaeon]